MVLDDLRLHHTQRLMDELASQVSFDDDSVTMVLVESPATRQRVLAVRRLDVPASQSDWEPLRDLLFREVRSLPIPPRCQDTRSIIVTVICRPGYNVWSRTEMTWAMGWRYSNHNSGAFDEDVIVVTEHGWASLLSHAAGHEPRLAGVA